MSRMPSESDSDGGGTVLVINEFGAELPFVDVGQLRGEGGSAFFRGRVTSALFDGRRPRIARSGALWRVLTARAVARLAETCSHRREELEWTLNREQPHVWIKPQVTSKLCWRCDVPLREGRIDIATY